MSYQHQWGEDNVYEDYRKVIAKCSFCKTDIHAGDENNYGDEAYFDHGLWACENCKDKFLQTFRVDNDS